MKKIIHFSKFFLPAVVISTVLILAGIVRTATKGINFGLDFKPGMIEEVKIAPTVLNVSYNGANTVSLDISSSGIDVIVSGVGSDNQTVSIPFSDVKKVSALADRLSKIEGVSVQLVKDCTIGEDGLFSDSTVSTKLSSTPLSIHASDPSVKVTADQIRQAVKGLDGADVKATGTEENASFQIRTGIGKDGNQKSIQDETKIALASNFGAENIVIVKSDFIGSQFSKSLIRDSIILVIATLALIWIYAAIRFHWDFAMAAVIALLHDSLIMIAFIAWTQMEFTTTTLAAILTIIGYSINATVVILDRVRFDMRMLETKNFKEILDSALTRTLSRSIITTVTTLFAVVSLLVFTTGSIHDFALALLVGLISGCYSSMFISGAFIAFARRSYDGNYEGKEKAIASKEHTFSMEPNV